VPHEEKSTTALPYVSRHPKLSAANTAKRIRRAAVIRSLLHNDQGERREAAAADFRFFFERTGCLPFARPCGLFAGLLWAF
jgi:hypothetical protein